MTYFLHGTITAFLMLSLFITLIDRGQTKSLTQILFFLFVISIAIGLVNFFRCSENIPQISKIIAKSSKLERMQSHYSLLGEDRLPVSKCVAYHDGSYFTEKNIECDTTKTCENVLNCSDDGAKLVDFYFASSNQSCMIPAFMGNYVSEEMLRTVIQGGARLVDLDVYTDLSKKGAYPVVKSRWGGRTALNSIPIKDCFSVILQEAFKKSTHEDPFFIHLNLKSYNLEMFDRLADAYIEVFPSKNLPSIKHTFHQENIALKPLCLFYNTFILIVSGKFDESKLREITNVSTSHGADTIRTFKDVEMPIDPSSEIYENRRRFSIVLPNEYSLNTNPGKSWSCGSQFFLMNYGNLESLMKSHNSFFKKHACIMKSFALQKSVTLVDTIEGSPES
jgi:hypothetical protein